MLQKDTYDLIHLGTRPNLIITKEKDFYDYIENLKLEHKIITSYFEEGHILKELQNIQSLVSAVNEDLIKKNLKDGTSIREPFVFIFDLSTVKSLSEEEINLLFNLVITNRNSLIYLTLVDKYNVLKQKSILFNLIDYEDLR